MLTPGPQGPVEDHTPLLPPELLCFPGRFTLRVPSSHWAPLYCSSLPPSGVWGLGGPERIPEGRGRRCCLGAGDGAPSWLRGPARSFAGQHHHGLAVSFSLMQVLGRKAVEGEHKRKQCYPASIPKGCPLPWG